jgi:hypothetical protein
VYVVCLVNIVGGCLFFNNLFNFCSAKRGLYVALALIQANATFFEIRRGPHSCSWPEQLQNWLFKRSWPHSPTWDSSLERIVDVDYHQSLYLPENSAQGTRVSTLTHTRQPRICVQVFMAR